MQPSAEELHPHTPPHTVEKSKKPNNYKIKGDRNKNRARKKEKVMNGQKKIETEIYKNKKHQQPPPLF